MKALFAIILIALGATVAHADTASERELKQLKDRWEKSLSAAVEPINKNYRASLEQLLRKATQAGDLDGALKVKQALSSIPQGARSLMAKPTTAEELKSYLIGTTWGISDLSPDAPPKWTVTFRKDGTFKDSRSGQNHPWAIEGANRIKLFNYDPASFDEEFALFSAQGANIKYFGRLQR